MIDATNLNSDKKFIVILSQAVYIVIILWHDNIYLVDMNMAISDVWPTGVVC